MRQNGGATIPNKASARVADRGEASRCGDELLNKTGLPGRASSPGPNGDVPSKTGGGGGDRFVGLVVRRPPRERKVPGSNPACAGIFSGSSHTSDLKVGTPVVTLPGAWRYRVRAATGRPGVSILWLGEMESWICNFYLSVAARQIVWADPSLRYTRMLLGR